MAPIEEEKNIQPIDHLNDQFYKGDKNKAEQLQKIRDARKFRELDKREIPMEDTIIGTHALKQKYQDSFLM